MKERVIVFVKLIGSSLFVTLFATLLPTIALADSGHPVSAVTLGHFDANMLIGLGSIVFAALIAGVVYREPSLQLTTADYTTIFLTMITGFIHLVLGFMGDWLLLVNGLGYLFFVVALFVPYSVFQGFRRQLRVVLLIYTSITFVGYFLLHPVEMYSTFDLVTKAVELMLMLVLALELLRGAKVE